MATAAPDPDLHCDESFQEVFALLGRRWTGLIIGVLMQRPSRFAEVGKAIPSLSDSMLSARLGELADAGLVEREVLEGPPLGALYRLTDKGEALRPALDALASWGEQYLIQP